MVAHSEACRGERGAGVAHVLVVDDVVHVLCACGVHVSHLRVLQYLSLAYRSDEFHVECACHLEFQSCLHSVVFFLDAGERHVREGVDVVEVVVLPVGDVGKAAVVSVYVGVEPRVLQLVSEFGAEHALVLEVYNEVVVYFR